MRNLLITLFLVNILTLGYALLTARTALPDWKNSFDRARQSASEMAVSTKAAEIQKAQILFHLDVAESYSGALIDEYKSQEIFVLLTLVNMVGLIIGLVIYTQNKPVDPSGKAAGSRTALLTK